MEWFWGYIKCGVINVYQSFKFISHVYSDWGIFFLNLFSEFRVKFEKTLSEQMIFLEIGSTTKLNLYWYNMWELNKILKPVFRVQHFLIES